MNVGNMKEICMPVIICAYHCYCVVCLSFVVGLNVVSTFMPIKHFSCHISPVLSVQHAGIRSATAQVCSQIQDRSLRERHILAFRDI